MPNPFDSTERCEYCMYFAHDERVNTSVCKRHSPIGIKMPEGSSINNSHIKREWPHVSEDDWCGDFQPVIKWFELPSGTK